MRWPRPRRGETIAEATSSASAIRPTLPRKAPGTAGPCVSGSTVTWILVIVPPGATQLTRTPCGRSMIALDLVSPTMACLLVVYAVPAQLPRSPASEPTLTIEPRPAAIIAGATAGEQEGRGDIDPHDPVPFRRRGLLRAAHRVHDSGVVDEDVDPAVLAEGPPDDLLDNLFLGKVTDDLHGDPVGCFDSATTALPERVDVCDHHRRPPDASARAVARPMPEPAPVTMAVLPLNLLVSVMG